MFGSDIPFCEMEWAQTAHTHMIYIYVYVMWIEPQPRNILETSLLDTFDFCLVC